MDRYPFIVYLGAAVLGKVSGEMIVTDPFVVKLLHSPGLYTIYGTQAACAVGVIVTGKMWPRLNAAPKSAAVVNNEAGPFYLPDWDLE
jgi:hypothetical protein